MCINTIKKIIHIKNEYEKAEEETYKTTKLKLSKQKGKLKAIKEYKDELNELGLKDE